MVMKKELKLGILAIAVLVATFFVINFLRGKDIFNREYELVSSYTDVQGLLPSSPVYIKGYKAGNVAEITYDGQKGVFDVLCTVSRDFQVPVDSRMTIYSADLMGGKAIRIDLGKSPEAASSGARLEPAVSPDMLSSIAAGIEPIISKGSEVLETLDSALNNLNLTLSAENRASLRSIMVNLDKTVAEVEGIASAVGSRSSEVEDFISNLDSLSVQLAAVVAKADSSMSDMNGVTSGLRQADIEGLVRSLNTLLAKVQEGEGTLGRLVNEDSVYDSLDSLIRNLDGLVRKIEENPKKYLKISVF